MENLILASGPLRNEALHCASDSSSPSSPSSPVSSCSNDKVELVNSILMWNSYTDFSKFCARIGLLFDNTFEARDFLNSVRSQQSLPPVNLEDTADCVELLGTLCLQHNYLNDYFDLEYSRVG